MNSPLARTSCLALALTALMCDAYGTEARFGRLQLGYSLDRRTCERAREMLKSDPLCRADDALHCTDAEIGSINMDGRQQVVFQELAVNQYGYTRVARASGPSHDASEIIYVSQFQGDHSTRILETWKVHADDYRRVLELPPGPIPYDQWIKISPTPPKTVNADEFAALLATGEKISDEWSPVIDIFGTPYAVKRECAGNWAFGGFYACNTVTKVQLIRLDNWYRSRPVCEFVRLRPTKARLR